MSGSTQIPQCPFLRGSSGFQDEACFAFSLKMLRLQGFCSNYRQTSPKAQAKPTAILFDSSQHLWHVRDSARLYNYFDPNHPELRPAAGGAGFPNRDAMAIRLHGTCNTDTLAAASVNALYDAQCSRVSVLQLAALTTKIALFCLPQALAMLTTLHVVSRMSCDRES